MSGLQRKERDAARKVGSRRTVRARGESAPDMAPVTLPSGETLQGEVKYRAKLPRLIADALAQASRYTPKAVAVAIVSQRGGRQIACIDLTDFARLVGIVAPKVPRERRKRAPKVTPSKQTVIPGCES